MVQIRRKRRTSPRECIRRSIGGVFQFVMVSSVIPATFWARHALFLNKRAVTDTTVTVVDKEVTSTTSSPTSSPNYLSVVTENPEYIRVFDFLNRVEWERKGLVGDSDVVELYHCRLQAMDMTNFTAWAYPIVNHTLTKASEQLIKRNPPAIPSVETWQRIREEFILELLEMRAEALHLCDFDKTYRPALPMDHDLRAEAAQRLQAMAGRKFSPESDGSQTRIVFSIVAHHDIDHLRQLIKAISMPQHYILLHLERWCPPEWEAAVGEIANSFKNVVVLKFGTILYETDLVSVIQYRIMHWITQMFDLPFDYFISLDGASFPLYSAADLVTQLVESGRHVWMGALLHRGTQVDVDQSGYLRNKRLLATRGDNSLKLSVRVPRIHFKNQVLPGGIAQYMNKKTNSGNQAVYCRSVVDALVASPLVRELFALSKYGCCCCLEERTWIAAMGLIGRQTEALDQASVWQAWGGTDSDCKSSMKNAVLTRNATVCFKVEDGTIPSQTSSIVFSHGHYFFGNETWTYLQNARARGILFARKFDSQNALSLELQHDVEEQLWATEEKATDQ